MNTPCSGCGIEVSPSNVLYTTEAKVVCAKCYNLADIVETDKRAAGNIKRAAIGCAIAGVISFFAPLGGIIAVGAAVLVAMTSGIFALQSMGPRNERFLKHLTGGDRTMIWICSIFGLAIAGLMGLSTLASWSLFFN